MRAYPGPQRLAVFFFENGFSFPSAIWTKLTGNKNDEAPSNCFPAFSCHFCLAIPRHYRQRVGDSLVEERAKYSYQLTPAELVYLPKLASAAGGRAVAAYASAWSSSITPTRFTTRFISMVYFPLFSAVQYTLEAPAPRVSGSVTASPNLFVS